MSALQAIPTPHGIDILNSELKNTVTKYQLIGALTHDAASDDLYSFNTATIETSYYDENGVLTFILNLPIETHFDEYLHRIDVLDSQNQAVIECLTPKIALAKGIGGMVTLKAAISGQAGDVIFKHGEYVTETELLEVFLSQYVKFSDRTGEWRYSDIEGDEAGWIDLKGGELDREIDALLWNRAEVHNLIVSQALKDAEPKIYAGYYGDGNGSNSFTLPNLHLGHFVRGNKVGVDHGETQSDAIRNIKGTLDFIETKSISPTGVFKEDKTPTPSTHRVAGSGYNSFVTFDASLVVPTADENRPDALNWTAKICRGWK